MIKEFLEILVHPMALLGLLGQACFFSRFVVQWVASEKHQRSVIPTSFWYLSIGGSLLVLVYALWRRDPVFTLGQSVGLLVYVRNLMLIHRPRRATGMEESDKDVGRRPADSPGAPGARMDVETGGGRMPAVRPSSFFSRMWRGLAKGPPPVWVIVLLAAALWGGEFLRRDLWEPDEVRYASVAREMRAGDHWIVPYLNGKPYPDKPPLMFWLINAASVLTGGEIDGVSARLPSLLGSILALWVVTRLLLRWHSAPAAWRGMLVLPTTYLFWKEGGWGRIDALLCGLVMMSVYFLLTSMDGRSLKREALGYVFAGLAVFAKGPIGLALAMGIFAVVAAAGGDGRKLRRAHWLWGPAVALAIPASWLLAAWLQGAPSGYFASMFGEKTFGRVVESIGHNRPFYYFLWHFPLGLLPWAVFAPAVLASGTDELLKRRSLGWIAFVIVLFSLFVCKRNIYILAAYPAAAVLIGAAWEDVSRLSRRWVSVTGGVAIALIWLLAVAAVVAMNLPRNPVPPLSLLPSACLLALGGALLTWLFRRERLSQRWFVSFCGILLALEISVTAVILPTANGLKVPVGLARAVKDRLPPNQPIYLYLHQLAIVPFYADRPGVELASREKLREVLAGQPNALVVFAESNWLEVQSEFAPMANVREFYSGRKHLILAEFAGK